MSRVQFKLGESSRSGGRREEEREREREAYFKKFIDMTLELSS
jgi:hypothetical protein